MSLSRRAEPLILASASARRKDLLASLGLNFDVVVADIDESLIAGESPEEYVARVALLKAKKIAKKHSQHCVIGADTAVVLGTKILGKPDSEAAAQAMLRLLSGKSHRVLTSVLILTPLGVKLAHTVQTKVSFASLSDQDIIDYCATGEPFGKADSYAIQGYGGRFVRSIDGSYTAVVGLPLYEMSQLLRQAGYNCGFGAQA